MGPSHPHVVRAPIPLALRDNSLARLVFRRGAHAPYATRWFGVTSLAGHARNFIASAIAAESIDSRDWMHPATARELLSHVVRVLGGDASRPTLVEAMGRPVWVDFVADTGDDRDVSQAVGDMLFEAYALEEGGEGCILERGDVLLFGGDTAYPVATGEEIERRVVTPWNEVLDGRGDGDGVSRAVLGIPGNHDWYDGLDGFGRLFRRTPRGATPPAEETAQAHLPRVPRPAGSVARQLHLDEVGGLLHMLRAVISSIRALWAGTKIHRPRRLALFGYEAVQDASYWALPLAPGLDVWGVDRQLGRLDYRQRLFFRERRRASPSGAVVFVAPEPAIAFGEQSESGARMLAGCALSFERDRLFYLTGDVHHYERRLVGDSSLQVIAGGGGAFLHGTRVSRAVGPPPARAWPSSAESRRLLAQVPLKLMFGGAGFMLHIAFAVVAGLELAASVRGTRTLVCAACAVAAALAGALYANVDHHRVHPGRVAALAVPFGVVAGLLPMALRLALPHIVPTLEGDMGTLLVCAFIGPLWIGFFLVAIALLGFEHQQAFCVLSHPGFKHFVRVRVHPDGRIDGWVIGKDDPLGPGGPVLIDRFKWDPRSGSHQPTAAA